MSPAPCADLDGTRRDAVVVPDEGDRRRLRAAAGVWTVLLALGTGVVLVAALPYSALASLARPLTPGQVNTVLPQGWGFFTRDPHEPRLSVFEHTSEGWVDASDGSNAQARYLFGLSRAPRAQGIEIGAVHAALDGAAWVDCAGTADLECLDQAQDVSRQRITSPARVPTLCGTVGLVERAPVPWAWRDKASPSDMDGRATVVTVTCDD